MAGGRVPRSRRSRSPEAVGGSDGSGWGYGELYLGGEGPRLHVGGAEQSPDNENCVFTRGSSGSETGRHCEGGPR